MNLQYKGFKFEIDQDGRVAVPDIAKAMGYSGSAAIRSHLVGLDIVQVPNYGSVGYTNYVNFRQLLDKMVAEKMHLPRIKAFVEHFRGEVKDIASAVTVEDAKAIVEATEPQLFDFDGHNVRVVMQDGEPWWVLKDVCDVLGLTNSRMVKQNLDEADVNSTYIRSGGQNRTMTTINESGLYDVILDSRKPQAKQFRRWVTNEVLPSIRKDGGYVLGQENMTPEEFELKALKFVKDKIESLEKQLEEARPQIEFANAVEASDKTITLTEMAKLIDSSVCPMNVTKLSQQLREEGYLFKRQVGGVTLPIRKYVEEGLFVVKETGYYDKFREEWIPQLQTRVTGKGQKFLIGKYSNCLV